MALYKHPADPQQLGHRDWLQVTLASIGDAVIACDAEAQVTVLSPVAETLTGRTAGEVLGMPIQGVARFISEQTRQPCDDLVARVLQDGRAVPLASHTALTTMDGREVPVEGRIAPIHDAARCVIGAVLVFHDVTEKRRAEEALAAAHEGRINILESIGEGFFALDCDYRVTYVNEKGAQLIGKPRAELLGRCLWESYPEAIGSSFHRAYQKALAEQEMVSVVEYYGPLNAWFEARAYPSPGGLSVFYRNVTEHRLIEEGLAFLAQSGVGPGDNFFQALARFLAETLVMDFVCIDQLEGDALAARTVAVYCDGKFEDNVTYTLKDTPCGELASRTVCCFPSGVRHRFPKDTVLQELAAESYSGITLLGFDGRPIGLIAVIGRRPLADPRLAESLLQLVAGRAARELERSRAEAALRQAHDELEIRVEERTRELADAVSRLETEVAGRIEAEAVLRETEERYRTLFSAAPIGIALTDLSGRVHDANAAMCAMLGLTLAEAQATNASSFYANPADRRRLLRRVQRETRVEDFETTLRRKDGPGFIASVKLTWVQIRDRQFFLTLVTDLTRRRRAERHIHGISTLQNLFVTQETREQYLQAVVHFLREWAGCACAGIRLLDSDGRLPFVASEGFTRTFLTEEGRIDLNDAPCPCLPVLEKGSGPLPMPHLRIQSVVLRNELADLVGPSTARGEECRTMPCVKARYASVAHVPVHHGGRFLGIIQLADRKDNVFPLETGQFLDSAARLVGEVLHRFSLESELRESEERFRSLFERHQAPMLLVDPASGAIVDANEAAERFYGFPPGGLTSRSIQELSGEPPSSADRAGSAATIPWLSRRGAFLQRLASGEIRTVEVHASPVTIRARTLLFSIIYDITEQRRLERQVLDITDRERQRIGRDLHDSLGGGLSGLAMLSKAMAQSLARSSPPEAAIAEEILQGIHDAVSQTRAIARGLCPVGLSAFGFVTGLEELARNTGKRHRVRCTVQTPEEVPIEQDFVATHLFQIAEEAVNNAVRHGHAKAIEIILKRQPRGYSMEVRDDGVGLPKDFDRKTGMGLHTMRYRAGVIGGLLEVYTPSTGGAVVSCLVTGDNPPAGAITPDSSRP